MPMKSSALLLFFSLRWGTASAEPVAAAERPVVTLSSGPVAGIASDSVKRFLGLPFAAPPVRFAPPLPAEPWEGIYDGSKSKPACVQKFRLPEDARERTMRWFNAPPPPAGESEDCLYLDIYTPADAVEGSNKAVMFWLFGGGFSFGSGSLPLYDGSSFARNQDIIIVSINYRTNIFGFPGSPELPISEQNLGTPLPLRFLDQRLALDWVRKNIHAFGGDPERITLFGESAGSGGVEVLVTNPPDPVPFAAAIMQSGQGSIALKNNTNSARSWASIIKNTNCDQEGSPLACVRSLPAARLKSIMESTALSFFPIYDGGATWKGTGRIDRPTPMKASTSCSDGIRKPRPS
ncbi:hypothetical protein XA68_14511 [Ophiocordyceps unilateralis]|uniref:Carboxylic ester hydrolase n=1 Tax=Ophiocordyceps unilateralis TaxID=268505 RepID=A0A2A9PMX6_OPHUN|nr:hypothetical protein XA68_14511 [Ophiocordyceps unilateralis]